MRGMIRRLRLLWNAPSAQPAPPKRVWRDWVLVAIIPPLAILEWILRPDVPSIVLAVIVTIVAIPTLLWRRSRPLLMLVIGMGITAVFRLVSGADIELYSIVYMLLLVYAVFRWGSGRAVVAGLAIMATTTSLSTLTRTPFDVANVIGAFTIVLLTITLGLLFRFRAASRLRELDRAKSDEREELARDLHDTVAHHVSAIAIQAQAGLATVGTNPDAATAALRVIEAEASRTLAEMRSMVRVLRRDGAAELAPAPQLADLTQLASGGSGSPVVNVQVSGEVSELTAPVASAVYRIAQESVTNARWHARGATRIDVRLTVDETLVQLSVHDDGTPQSAAVAGYGLTGMAERAALLGGSCSAAPDADGGWTVVAELPRSRVRS